jgi:hypothetical protein
MIVHKSKKHESPTFVRYHSNFVQVSFDFRAMPTVVFLANAAPGGLYKTLNHFFNHYFVVK